MIDLLKFQKPQRYMGNEWNVVKKSHDNKVTICLSYPDLYEIGMSNLGLRIIYGLLNENPGVVCERVFMPGLDLAQFLKKQKKKLFSLETKTPLDEFELLGFHLGCELNFTNFLNLLNLGAIPLKSKERPDIIVMGGGIANPEPLAEFIDLFYIGEFEETASEFIAVLQKYKNKEERLKVFSQLPGFYVPEFYSSILQDNRYHFEKKYAYAQLPIKKVHVKDLNNSYYPRKWLTPHTQIIHDRAQVEISRGCPNRCTFCQARATYFPYRERKPQKIKEIITNIYENSGYENFSLLSLSASDHSSIEEIIDMNYDYFNKNKIGLSLPSLRVDDFTGQLYKRLNSLKKTSLTVAVETARDCLRNKLNKKIDTWKLFEAAKVIRSLGAKQIKIYFMFGFTEENEDDLIAIGRFLDEIKRSSKLLIKASINIFSPKPFSLWENSVMDNEDRLRQKKEIILKNIPRSGNIKISLSSPKRSILETILSRADRSFSSVIYRAYKKGAKFDNYHESFSWDIWEQAMAEAGIDYRFYLEAKTENYPWSFIDSPQSMVHSP